MKATRPGLRQRWRELPLGRKLGWLVGLWLLSGLVVVGPAQVGVVRVCGKAVYDVDSGLGWRPPWPISRLNLVRVWERRQVGVGVSMADTAVGRGGGLEEEHITGDQNLLRIQATVQYMVKNPRAYLFQAAAVDKLVAATVQSHLTSEVALDAVDDLMTTGREALKQAVLAASQQTLDAYGVGVTLDTINLRQIQPPGEVAAAFNDVNSAKQDYDRLINEAHGYENETVPKALGEATELRAQAEGYQLRRVNEATGQADRFVELEAEYARSPQVTRIRLHLETVEQIAPRLQTTVVDAAGGQRPIDLGVLGAAPVGQP